MEMQLNHTEVLGAGETSENIFFGFLGNLSSPLTQKAYKKDLEIFADYLKEKFPGTMFLTVTHEHIVSYKLYLLQFGGRKGQAASPKSVNRRLSCLKKFYRFLCQRKILEKSPLEFIDHLRVSSQVKTQSFTQEEWEKLMQGNPRANFTECMHQAVLAVFLTTAMRKSELINLTLDGLKQEEKFLVVEFMAKNSKLMKIPLHEKSAFFLLQYLRMCRERGYEFGPKSPVFRSTQKKNGRYLENKLSANSIDYILKKAGERIGIEPGKIHAHRTRATVITLLNKRGVGPREIQQVAGHKSVKMSMEYITKNEALSNSPVFLL